MVFGAFGEISEEARTLLCYAADATAARTWVEDGATSQEHAAALLKNRLYRRWGIETAREYARIKIDGLRLVVRQPGLHGDRARRRRRTLLRPAASLRTRSRHPSQAAKARGPKTRIDYSYLQSVSESLAGILAINAHPYRG